MWNLVVMASLLAGCDAVFGLAKVPPLPIDAPPVPPDVDPDTLPHHVRTTKLSAAAGTGMPTVTLMFPSLGPGDTIFLGMCRRPGATTVTSVTDSIGSTYTDLGVDKQMNNTSSSAWFGHVNEGSADPVTVTISFSGAGADGLDVRAVEYARVASIGPHAQNSSNSAYGITVGVHLDSVPALAVVSTCVASATLAIGGFEEESRTSNGNVTGSQLFTTVQDVSVEPTQSSESDMIVDLVTLVGTQ